MTCPDCESSEPIYQSGCSGCEARALAVMELPDEKKQEESNADAS